jgi:hypothetical protein
MKIKIIIVLSLFLLSFLFFSGCISQNPVTYEVTFDATWSETTHPDDFPPNPHFSGLIGASHNDEVTFWRVGELATPGIQNMAETGNKNPLTLEIGQAIMKRTAFQLISGGGIANSPGTIKETFKVSEDYPLVTLVTMIAPSPDWFVGVDSLNLYINGSFIDEITIVLYPYDAGTDSGTNYTSANNPTNPAELIFAIEGYPFYYNNEVVPLGTFTFKKL